MDQVYRSRCAPSNTRCNNMLIILFSDTGVLHIHNVVPSPVLRSRPCHRVLNRIPRDCTPAVDWRCLLFCSHSHTYFLPVPRLCMEIVRFLTCSQPHGAYSLHSYRRTYLPASYHIAQELQKYNIPDYRPRQEQLVLCNAVCRLGIVLIFLGIQVPKSDQESQGGAAHATQPRIRI